MKGNSAFPRGSSKSKPAWLSTLTVFDHAGFFVREGRDAQTGQAFVLEANRKCVAGASGIFLLDDQASIPASVERNLEMTTTLSDHLELLRHLIDSLAKRARLSSHDREDAQQQAVLGFPEVAESFAASQLDTLAPHDFCAYLSREVSRQFRNSRRRDLRRKGPVDNRVRVEKVVEIGKGFTRPGHADFGCKCDRELSPAEVLRHEEDLLLLVKVIRELPVTHYRLVMLKLSDRSLRSIAEEMKVSYPTICRWHKRALGFLQERLTAVGIGAETQLFAALNLK